jgi:hypothetical protein
MKIFGRQESIVDTVSLSGENTHTNLECSAMMDSISSMISNSDNFIQLWSNMETAFKKIMGSHVSKLHFMINDEDLIASLKHTEGTSDERFRFRELAIKDDKTTIVEIKRRKDKEVKLPVSKKSKSPSKFKI